MVDILLVNSPVKRPEVDVHARLGPPLGLGYIASVLLENSFSVGAIDMNVPPPDFIHSRGWGFEIQPLFDELMKKVEKEQPMMVGISACTETYPNALRIARVVKKVNPKIITVVGGPHVTFLPSDTLMNPEIDIVVRNEGELTMLELARHYKYGLGDLKEIKGINFRIENKPVSTPNRPFIENLDFLPFPARQLFPLHHYRYPANLLTARGCPGQCIFCAAEAMSGGKYRMRSPENVVSELLYLISRYNFKYFVFVDDTFTASKGRTLRICDLIIKSGLDIKWACSTRINAVDEEILKRMSDSGCDNINFGIESGSQKILNSIRKGIDLSHAEKVIKLALKFGIIPVCSFMFPHPDDTEETIKETKKLILKLLDLGCHISIAITTPFPGTYLYEHAKELGIEILSNEWEDFDCDTPVINTKFFQKEDIYKLKIELLDFTIL